MRSHLSFPRPAYDGEAPTRASHGHLLSIPSTHRPFRAALSLFALALLLQPNGSANAQIPTSSLHAGTKPTNPSFAVLQQQIVVPPGDVLFEATQKSLQEPFKTYWFTHGQIPQQGYPLTDQAKLISTDGKEYTSQVFERAVFESHPEDQNQPVKLRLLGAEFLRRAFPDTIPSSTANTTNPLTFPETGRTIGGDFRQYWETNGGLEQQGYPLTDEFALKSTDGKEYTSQVFERAVFEQHPEDPAHPVKLRLLGAEELQRLTAPKPTATSTRVSTPTKVVQPTASPTHIPPTANPRLVYERPFAAEYPWLEKVSIKGISVDEGKQLDYLSRETMKGLIDDIFVGFEAQTGKRPDANGYIDGGLMPRSLGVVPGGPLANYSILRPSAPMRLGFKEINIEYVDKLPAGATEIHGGSSENWLSIYNDGEKLTYYFDNRVPLKSLKARELGSVADAMLWLTLAAVDIEDSENFNSTNGTNYLKDIGLKIRSGETAPLTKSKWFTDDGAAYTWSAFTFR